MGKQKKGRYQIVVFFIVLTDASFGPWGKDDYMVPVHLLVWAVQTVITTLTCIVDFMSWEDITREETVGLAGLYCPYCVLGTALSHILCR